MLSDEKITCPYDHPTPIAENYIPVKVVLLNKESNKSLSPALASSWIGATLSKFCFIKSYIDNGGNKHYITNHLGCKLTSVAV